MLLKPTKPYSGITLVLSYPSRMDIDNKSLLSGNARFFIQDCFGEGYPLESMEIRTCSESSPFLKHTKAIVLFGEKSFHTLGGEKAKSYLLQEQRGYLLNVLEPYYVIATFSPQDCMDREDYESKFNEEIKQDKFNREFIDLTKRIKLQDSSIEQISDKRKHGNTSRENYRFWVSRDIRKIKMHLEGVSKYLPSTEEFNFHIYPELKHVIERLRNLKDSVLCIDIETDSELNITCMSIGFNKTVICVPLIRYDYSLAYNENTLALYMATLAKAIQRNTVVCHNSMFDLFILAWKYNIPAGEKNYDTMLAHHRCFVDMEKSLGHCISHLLMWESFHKDEGIFEPKNRSQEEKLWKYNAKDVAATMLVYRALEQEAKNDTGIARSIEQSNECILPFLTMQLQGIRYNIDKLEEMKKENDRLLNHYLRAIKYLIGDDNFLPSSPQQVSKYFERMNYAVINRSELTGRASWNEEAQQELKLKLRDKDIYNPAIDFILKFREVRKEYGSLKFIPWLKEDEDETSSS